MAFVLRCLRDFFFSLRAAFGSCSHPGFRPFTTRILGEEAEPIWSKQLTLRSICPCLQRVVVSWERRSKWWVGFSPDLKDLCHANSLWRFRHPTLPGM